MGSNKSFARSKLWGPMLTVRRIAVTISLCLILPGCSLLFPVEAGDSLSHYAETAPAEADLAPDFTLAGLDGEEVSLGDLVGDKPVVLQLGSYSCPVFRYRRYDMQELQQEFAGRVEFVVVYTQEAHPYDANNPYTDKVWNPLINKVVGINVAKHLSLEQRRNQAVVAYDLVNLESLFVVDDMDNSVWQQYGAAPSAAYVIDLDGRVYLRQPWVNPSEIRDKVIELLDQY